MDDYNFIHYFIIKKVVVKFYNCIKQIIKKIIKKWWLNFIYSQLKLQSVKNATILRILWRQNLLQ